MSAGSLAVIAFRFFLANDIVCSSMQMPIRMLAELKNDRKYWTVKFRIYHDISLIEERLLAQCRFIALQG